MDPSVVLSVTGTCQTPQAFERPRYSSGPSAFAPPGRNSSFEYTGQVTQVEPATGSVAAPVRTPVLARIMMLTLIVH